MYTFNERVSATPTSRKEPQACLYYFGCYLVAIRPYKEGRFFKKEYVFDKTENNGKLIFKPGIFQNNCYLTHVTELMNETEYALIDSFTSSLTFDVPSAYCMFSLDYWQNELKDSQSLYEQQDSMAKALLKKQEFETLDALLRKNRDFVTSQNFYEVGL